MRQSIIELLNLLFAFFIFPVHQFESRTPIGIKTPAWRVQFAKPSRGNFISRLLCDAVPGEWCVCVCACAWCKHPFSLSFRLTNSVIVTACERSQFIVRPRTHQHTFAQIVLAHVCIECTPFLGASAHAASTINDGENMVALLLYFLFCQRSLADTLKSCVANERHPHDGGKFNFRFRRIPGIFWRSLFGAGGVCVCFWTPLAVLHTILRQCVFFTARLSTCECAQE